MAEPTEQAQEQEQEEVPATNVDDVLQIVPEIFKTPEFSKFQERVKGQRWEEEAPFNFGEILATVPEEFEELARIWYSNYLIQKSPSESDRQQATNYYTDARKDFQESLEERIAAYSRPAPEQGVLGYSSKPDIESEEVQRLKKSLVQHESYYGHGDTLYDSWIKGKTGLDDETSPWRIKAMYFPEVLYPDDAKFLMKNHDPDAEFQFIDPKDPDYGLAVRSPKTNNQWMPFRPKFGREWLGQAAIQTMGQEATAIVAELLGTRFLPGNVGKWDRGLWRVGREAGIATAATVLGRFSQLAYGRAQGINNIDMSRAADDAGMAAYLAGAGSVGTSLVLGLAGRIWKTITGTDIPQTVFNKIRAEADKIKRVSEKTTSEFSEKEIKRRIEQLGHRVEDAGAYRTTLGEESQDDYFKQLELDLFAYLGTDSEGKEVFNELMRSESTHLQSVWEALTKGGKHPAAEFGDWKKYVEDRQKEATEAARETLEAAKTRISTEVSKQTDELLFGTAPRTTREATEELAEPFIRTSQEGTWFRHSSPEMLKIRDKRYEELLREYEQSIKDLNLQYPKKTTENVRFISGPVTDFARGSGRQGDLIRNAEASEAPKVLREMVPMREGFNSRGEPIQISTMMQLMGLHTDASGKILPKLQPTLGDLSNMLSSVRHTYLNHPTSEVRKHSEKLMRGIEEQIDDLLEVGAEQEMRKAGMSDSITKNKVEEWMNETGYGAKFRQAQEALENYSSEMDRKWLSSFVKQNPKELADYVLNSSPKNITKLLQELYRSPESVIKQQNIRELVLRSIARELGDGDIASKNKNWKRYIKKYEDQLEVIFPASKFKQFKSFDNFLETTQARLAELDGEFKALEKKINKPILNFVSDFIDASASKIRSQDNAALDQVADTLKEYPELQPMITGIFKDRLKARFERQSLQQTGTQGREGEFLKGAFDYDAFEQWVSGAYSSGPTGTNDLGRNLGKLLGKEQGNLYAKDLRLFNVALQRAQDRRPKGPLLEGSTATKMRDEIMNLFATIQRVVFSPLDIVSRRVTVGKEKVGERAVDNLLEILVDPSKLRRLMMATKMRATASEWLVFLAAVAESRSVDIGSEKNRNSVDRDARRILKLVGEEPDPVGKILEDIHITSPIVGPISRVPDRIDELWGELSWGEE